MAKQAANTSNAFESAWKSKAAGQWKKSREVKAEATLNVPKGNYIAQITRGMTGVDKNGNPYVIFRFVILSEDEDCNGQTGQRSHFLFQAKPTKEYPNPTTLEEKMNRLSKDLQNLGMENVEGSDFKEINNFIKGLSNSKPLQKISVNPSSTPGGDPLVYFNGPPSDEDAEAVSEMAEEEADDEVEEDEVDLNDLDRTALKGFIKEQELDIKVTKAMSDDDIREAITEAMEAMAGGEEEAEEEPEEEEEPEAEEEAAEEEEEEAEEETEEEEEEAEEEEETEEEEEEEEEEAPKKKTTKKATKKATTKKATKKVAKPTKGATVLYSARAGAKAQSCKVKAISRDGLLTLVRDSDKREFKEVDPADLA